MNSHEPARSYPPANPDDVFDLEPDDQQPPLRLSSGEDIVCLVPYLLGFHPEDSIVVLACDDRRLTLTARFGLDCVEHPLALDARLAAIRSRTDHPQWIMVGYGADRARVCEALDVLIGLVGEPNVVDAIYADQGRYWSLLCYDDDCCPSEGRAYDWRSSRAAVEAVVSGLQAADSREDLTRRILPPKGWAAKAARARVQQATELVRRMSQDRACELLDALLDVGLADPDALDVDDLAMMAALTQVPVVRDVALRRLQRRDAVRHVAIWQKVAQTTAKADQATVLAVLGLASWVSGDGAMQVVCLERAERLAPGLSLLGLLDEINRLAVPPVFWDEMVAQMDRPTEHDQWPVGRDRRLRGSDGE